MQSFDSDGIQIAYRDEGAGDPILLIHGFASNHQINWVGPGWFETLTGAGYRVVALDNRGHGQSEKLYDPAFYPSRQMAGDARRLLDHLDIDQAVVMGYSMGARISAFLNMDAPERVSKLVFGGLGINMVRGIGGAEIIAEALRAPTLREVEHPVGRAFRAFAEQTGSDREALATCILASRDPISEADVRSIETPVLVGVGSKDEVSGDGPALVDLLPQGQFLDIARRDHMTAVGDKVFKAGVLEFLEG
ncbi:MAG: alpha/beta hydrolase [Rhizobiales bacterium]|nr:alpha/beta hydrolase [Hyphomicrobiales bacterium]MBO6697812.1 alpha/beta hydrolase [Hyphomicrobiales bacterium]MBO6735933.1 alpha/beta hydrolase [Hyphomicrobiales bacterium]MBO6912403.1 alpha/beta hydrolase [Hyphomicrobiales bacterium]MBO6955033.1 alpha/beta hydrolase [Hyphomicrobiales bacterium]